MRTRYLSLFSAFLAFLLFQLAVFERRDVFSHRDIAVDQGRVVLPAPLLVLLYGGDSFLAADLETIRLASTSVSFGRLDSDYLVRSQQEVVRLNPCHEDNYYLANGLLTWGGAVEEGNSILKAAIECRFWDGVPGFFYAVNKAFFSNDIDAAEVHLRQSALRWSQNSAALLKLAVVLRAESFANERLALEYLIAQRDSAQDKKLRSMLDKRVSRLEGLLFLRDAQRRYELNSGPLSSLQDLVSAGFIEKIPEDPLGIGYQLHEGRIELKRLIIAGQEIRR